MMKKSITAGLVLAMFTLVAIAQSGIDSMIKFARTEHQFGKIPKDKSVTVSFEFTNPTSKPLIIEDATAECGCTKPEFPKKPVMPGKTGTITVTYDAKEPGAFTKRVTVSLVNVKETKILTISGEVQK